MVLLALRFQGADITLRDSGQEVSATGKSEEKRRDETIRFCLLSGYPPPTPLFFVCGGNKRLMGEFVVSRGNIGVSGKRAAERRKLE